MSRVMLLFSVLMIQTAAFSNVICPIGQEEITDIGTLMNVAKEGKLNLVLKENMSVRFSSSRSEYEVYHDVWKQMTMVIDLPETHKNYSEDGYFLKKGHIIPVSSATNSLTEHSREVPGQKVEHIYLNAFNLWEKGTRYKPAYTEITGYSMNLHLKTKQHPFLNGFDLFAKDDVANLSKVISKKFIACYKGNIMTFGHNENTKDNKGNNYYNLPRESGKALTSIATKNSDNQKQNASPVFDI